MFISKALQKYIACKFQALDESSLRTGDFVGRGTQPKPLFLARTEYDALVAALMDAPRTNPLTGEPDADGLKIALGEAGDIWPESIAVDHDPAELAIHGA